MVQYSLYPLDKRVLEALQRDGVSSPCVLALKLGLKVKSVHNTLDRLKMLRLIDNPIHGVYIHPDEYQNNVELFSAIALNSDTPLATLETRQEFLKHYIRMEKES